MRIMAIDSSSVCSGIVLADTLEDGSVLKVGSAPIIPSKFDVTSLGYLKTKKKMPGGFLSYVKNKEETVSKTESKKRNVEVRHKQNNHKAKDIGKQLSYLIENTKPDLVLIERNRIFNSQLTSVLLGEIMGIVEGVCASYNITLEKFTVDEMRKSIDSTKLVKEFSKKKTEQELISMKDVTKEAIKDYLVNIYNKYGFNPSTLDESDACLVFHYWFCKEMK